MSKVLLIAQREMGAFFSTWMGYIIAAMALFINGLLFNAFAIGDTPEFSAVILSRFFYFSSGICMVSGVFLAMRLLAEEKQTGTIVLLFTSPISERQLIYGKFLSAVFFFLFLQMLTLYLPALIMVKGKISLGHLGAGYLGTSLLGAAVLAIVLFASVVSPNQLVAAVLGAFLTVTILVLWMVSSVVEPPLKELFSYLAIHNAHFDPFRKGIVHTKDIVYYCSLIVFFLECSVRALEARRLQG